MLVTSAPLDNHYCGVTVMGNDTTFPPLKRCSRCGEVKPLDAFSISRDMKDGRRSDCASCRKQARKDIARKRERILPPEKTCRKCGELKISSMFNLNPHSGDNLDAWCKSCLGQARRTRVPSPRRVITPDRIQVPLEKMCFRCKIIQPSQSFKRNRNKLDGLYCYCRTCQREIYRANASRVDFTPPPEKWCNCCKQTLPNSEFGAARGTSSGLTTYCKVCTRMLDKRNLVYKRIAQHKRRALKRANGGTFTQQDYEFLIERQQGICAYCAYSYPFLVIDHVIPLRQGGRNDISNIVLACNKCNSQKNNKTPKQWDIRWYLV